MTQPTKRDLEREITKLKNESTPGGTTDLSVKWCEAASENRPSGMAYDADSQTISYDVWSAQESCLETLKDGDVDIVAFLAGYGSGKSVLGARWLLSTALEHSNSRFLAMGVDFQKARETTFHKLYEQLPGERTTLTGSGYNGPENSPLVKSFNQSTHRLTLVNDSVITLGSADTYDRYAGAEFGAVWMDEPSLYGEKLHDLSGIITSRLRSVAGPKQQLWTLTGEGYNAAWEILEKRQNSEGEEIGLDIELVRASVLDNPYLTEGAKERFKRQFEGTGKEEQALHGGFGAATGLVYSEFNRNSHVISDEKAKGLATDDWRIYGYDAGWDAPRVLLEIGRSDFGQLIVLDEFYRRECHVEDAIAWLKSKDKSRGTIYAEHEPSDIKKLTRNTRHTIRKAEKSIDAGIEEVRHRLQEDDGRRGLLIA